jgi:hypothetical protein
MYRNVARYPIVTGGVKNACLPANLCDISRAIYAS